MSAIFVSATNDIVLNVLAELSLCPCGTIIVQAEDSSGLIFHGLIIAR